MPIPAETEPTPIPTKSEQVKTTIVSVTKGHRDLMFLIVLAILALAIWVVLKPDDALGLWIAYLTGVVTTALVLSKAK